jgi:hypothetical protein
MKDFLVQYRKISRRRRLVFEIYIAILALLSVGFVYLLKKEKYMKKGKIPFKK